MTKWGTRARTPLHVHQQDEMQAAIYSGVYHMLVVVFRARTEQQHYRAEYDVSGQMEC